MTYHYYWFAPGDGRIEYDRRRKPRRGRTHKVDCTPQLFAAGLHASRDPHDALRYWRSGYLWRVQLGGTVVHGDDISFATERTYIAHIDATYLLWLYARLCALDVINLWDAPDVVREYLRTGDESNRDAARVAAWDAVRAAARAVSVTAEWDAVRDAARAAAWAAARVAPQFSPRAAVWDAATNAVRAAASAAAWDAASAAAGAAAWDAARDAQRRRFVEMVNQAFEREAA